MHKIPTLFVRDPDDMSRVTRHINVDALWMLDEGIPRAATVKKDGSNVQVVGHRLGPRNYTYTLNKRRNPSRQEKQRAKQMGRPIPEPTYVPADRGKPEDQYLYKAFDRTFYELGAPVEGAGEWPAEALGKKIQGGAEGDEYRLYFFTVAPDIIHPDPGPDYDEILKCFTTDLAMAMFPIEGIVWHALDGSGKMAKIKRRDFGLEWPVKGS